MISYTPLPFWGLCRRLPYTSDKVGAVPARGQADHSRNKLHLFPPFECDGFESHAFRKPLWPDELGKAEQHCSVSNSAQTHTIVGGSVLLWVALFGPEEGTRSYVQSNPRWHDDGSAICEHAVARNRKRALLWELALVRGSRKLRPGSQSSGCRMEFIFHGWRTEGSGTRLGRTEHSARRS